MNESTNNLLGNTEKVIVRYPPSPTGEIHIGNIRTMLFNYLFAQQNGGSAVLRFEDTDMERSAREHEQWVIDALGTLGIDYQNGPYRQSERTDRYVEAVGQLIESGHAYEAEQSNDGLGKVVRFKNPNKRIAFNDIVRGEVTIDTTDFGDFVIARSMTDPIYHLTVVVDDIDMNISHVIRGEDHITSTPRQILLFEALGAELPVFAHLPMIVGDDKKKLSKRHGAVTVRSFIEQGYVSEAIVNYLALLGWHPSSDDREIFSMEELIKEFDLTRVGKNPAMFDYKKLDDINRHHIMELSAEEYRRHVMDFLSDRTCDLFDSNIVQSDLIIELIIRERIDKFSDVREMETAGEFDYLFRRPEVSLELVRFKEQETDQLKRLLKEVIEKLQTINKWNKDEIKDTLFEWSGTVEGGRGAVLHPMRTSLSGAQRSPDPFTLATVLGRNETFARLQAVLEIAD